MIEYNIIRTQQEINKQEKETFISFLYDHLGQYGDTRPAITNAVDYALSTAEGKGGFLLTAWKEGKRVGEVVVNDTGMEGYIPEHALVYIAVKSEMRGHGIGTALMKKTLEICEGNVKLHVEYDNPAKRLYERVGFTSKYAEMRYQQE